MLAAILVPLNNAGVRYSGSDANSAPADAAAMALAALYAEANATPTDSVTFALTAALLDTNLVSTDAAQHALTALLADANSTPADTSALGAGMGNSDAIAAQVDVMVQMRQAQALAQAQTQTQQTGTQPLDTFLPQRVNYQPSYSPEELKRLRRLERKLARLRGQVARAAAKSDTVAVQALQARISTVIEEIGDEDEELLVIAMELDGDVQTFIHLAMIAARVIH